VAKVNEILKSTSDGYSWKEVLQKVENRQLSLASVAVRVALALAFAFMPIVNAGSYI